MFNLKKPCNNCPFRKGFGERYRLPEDRLREIMTATSFDCHKTTRTVENSDGSTDRVSTRDSQHCVGLMVILDRLNRPNQMMRIGERMGMIDYSTLDPKGEVYDSWSDAMDAHCGGGR